VSTTGKRLHVGFRAYRWTAAVAAVAFAACSRPTEEPPQYRWGIDPAALPDVVTEADFPELPMGSADRIWGLAGKDLSGKDLTNLSADFLSAQTFDDNTRWPRPAMLPAAFSPDGWLEIGKDPGLGVRDLHRQGITGQGVAVALVDKPIRHQHKEFEGRIHYFEVFGDAVGGFAPHFHGIACASILAGSTVGVAPEATIHYFAVPDVGENFRFYSIAADKIIEVNRSLSEERRIRLVSISDGLGRENPYRGDWEAALLRLGEAGIEVVYSSPDRLNGFTWGGAAPLLHRSPGTNYESALYFLGAGIEVPLERIIIPGDYRATASNRGEDLYVYWGEGGWSWAIPYAAGLAALAWQLEPTLTFAQIEELLRETAGTTKDGRRVITPTAFIEAVKRTSG
jgi:serine protease AprX